MSQIYKSNQDETDQVCRQSVKNILEHPSSYLTSPPLLSRLDHDRQTEIKPITKSILQTNTVKIITYNSKPFASIFTVI